MDHVIALAGKCEYTDVHNALVGCPPLIRSTTHADDVRLIIPIIGQDVRDPCLTGLRGNADLVACQYSSEAQMIIGYGSVQANQSEIRAVY